MALTATDWIVIAVYLALNLLISLYYRRRSSGSTEEFFVSGRNVVVAVPFGDDDRFFLRALLAAFGNLNRRRVCRTALCRKTRRFSPRFSRPLSGGADELPDPRLGDQGNDQHHHGVAWRCHRAGSRTGSGGWRACADALHARRSCTHGAADLRAGIGSVHRHIYVHRRALGRFGHGFIPVHPEDDHDHRARVGCGRKDRRNDTAEDSVVAR